MKEHLFCRNQADFALIDLLPIIEIFRTVIVIFLKRGTAIWVVFNVQNSPGPAIQVPQAHWHLVHEVECGRVCWMVG